MIQVGSLAPLPLVSMGRAAYPSPPPALPPGVWLSDVWFVRVRGMHSAPLKKHHVRTLFEARELTADSPARNENWPEDAWSPIYLIPELAKASQMRQNNHRKRIRMRLQGRCDRRISRLAV